MLDRLTLPLRFLGLSAFWGFILGAGSGLVAGVLLSLPSLSLNSLLYAGMFYLLYYAEVGVLIGAVAGVILGVITTIFYYDPQNLARYQTVALIVFALTAFFGSFFWFFAWANFYSETGGVQLGVVLIPTLVATLVLSYASRRVAKWYLGRREYNEGQPIATD